MAVSITIAAVVSGLLALADVTPPPAATEPNGKWMVAYEEGMCVLSRRYGEGIGAVDIGFRPIPFVEQMQIVTVGPPSAGGARFGKASLALDDVAGKPEPYGSFPLGSPAHRVTTTTTTDDILQKMADATTLTMVMGSTTLRFRLRAAAAAVKALRTCQDDLVRHWGLDPATLHAEASHARLAGSGPVQWFGPQSYPTSAIRVGAQGRTVAVLVVSAEGKPTSCKIVESAGNADLDGTTCRIAMQRSAFVPARDAQDRPVASWYVLPVRWSMSH